MRKESHHLSQVHQVQQHETTLTLNLQNAQTHSTPYKIQVVSLSH